MDLGLGRWRSTATRFAYGRGAARRGLDRNTNRLSPLPERFPGKQISDSIRGAPPSKRPAC